MIKIIEAKYKKNYSIEVIFSTNEKGLIDFSYLLSKETELTKPLKDISYFKDFFIELGALAWKNGLEFSPKSLYKKLQDKQALCRIEVSA